MGMQQVRLDLATRREEILWHVEVVLKRRGPDSTIEIDVLCTVLAAKFQVLRADMMSFLVAHLSSSKRISFKTLMKKDVQEKTQRIDRPVLKLKPLKKQKEEPEFIIEWITVAELREMHAEAAAAKRAEKKKARNAVNDARVVLRSLRESETSQSHAQQEAQKAERALARITAAEQQAATRAARTLLRNAEQSVREAERTRKKQEREAQKEKKLAEQAEVAKARAERRAQAALPKLSKPAKPVVQKIVKKAKPKKVRVKPSIEKTPSTVCAARVVMPLPQRVPPTIAQLVERAVKALKGVTDITELTVSVRALMYRSDHDADKIKRYVKNLPKDLRQKYGFAGTQKKKPSSVKLRPVPPSITAKGIT